MQNSTQRTMALWAGILGFLGVIAGTFGAHGLPKDMDPYLKDVFDTGVMYHVVHALALVGCAALFRSGWRAKLCSFGFGLGILLFSGSLYALALTGEKWLGMIAPIGGLAFLTGWVALILEATREPGD